MEFGGLLLSLVTDYMSDDVLRTCKLVNKWFMRLCREKQKIRIEKSEYVRGQIMRQFAFFSCLYSERKIVTKKLTFRHLALVMSNVTDRLGKGYSIKLSSACQSGFRLSTPDGRECEIRFSGSDGDVKVRKLDKFDELSYQEILGQSEIDTDLMSWDKKNPTDPSNAQRYLALYAKHYPNESDQAMIHGVNFYEYRILCEAFSNITGAKMSWCDPLVWANDLPLYKQWLWTNRVHIFEKYHDADFVREILHEDTFPDDDPVDMLNFLQWLKSNQIEKFAETYEIFERDTQKKPPLFKDMINRCLKCKRIIDRYSTDFRWCEYCSVPSDAFDCCLCKICCLQKNNCDLHWIKQNGNMCCCSESCSESSTSSKDKSEDNTDSSLEM